MKLPQNASLKGGGDERYAREDVITETVAPTTAKCHRLWTR